MRTGRESTFDGDVVVLAEDAPVALRHLGVGLLAPVAVVPLLLLLALLLLLEAHLLLRLLGLGAPLLQQVAVELQLALLLRFDVDAGQVAAPVELDLVALLVDR